MNDNWINVKDRLPETNDIGIAYIIAYDRIEGIVKAKFLDEKANFVGGDNIFIIDHCGVTLHHITHWMPLPEKPIDN